MDETTSRAVKALALKHQRTHRVPGIYAGVVRDGSLIWQAGVGAADLDHPDVAPDPDDQFLVASNTKTFTATLIMQLRDEGRLGLDDTLTTYIPEITGRPVTIRSALSHESGLQREPIGDVWETLVSPDTPELLDGFNRAERILEPHRAFHYSNLVYSLLGEVVARVDGRPWAESLQGRLLDPLEMRRTTVGFQGRRAKGYYVPPYSDVPVPERAFELRALAPCAGLASTAEDMARWSSFVAAPPAEVLDPDTLEEMVEPRAIADLTSWQAALGLGFMLVRSGQRVYVGHTGGMPGFITGLFTDRAAGTGGLVLMNASSARDPAGLAIALADHVTEHDPAEPAPWRPGREVPAELAGVLGLWFSEGRPYEFSVCEGLLQARAQGQPEGEPPAVFERIEADRYRVKSGLERGELLRITRASDGSVVKMNWATYRYSRLPLAFGEPDPTRAPTATQLRLT